jgi:formylglycine-generating enzyme required for sulfatase activity
MDKPLTRDREDDLRQAGATDELIRVIRENSPQSDSPPTPTPTATPPPTPSPTPASTPRPKQIKNSIGMEFVLIPPGSFTMGSPYTEKDRRETEGPPRRVTINRDFYLGKYEVTIGQWRAVMGDLPEGMKSRLSDDFKASDNQPVVRISWSDAKTFIAKLNSLDRQFAYRLPSEAEWEYAARAGSQTRFYWGDDPDYGSICRYANIGDFSDCPDNFEHSAPVGRFSPNAFGLYDMTGNVWEWCEDIWQDSLEGLPVDGSANLSLGDSGKRVLRGASWADYPKNSRVAVRDFDDPNDRNDEDGLRLVARSK